MNRMEKRFCEALKILKVVLYVMRSSNVVARGVLFFLEDERTLVFVGKDTHESGIEEKRTYFSIKSKVAFSLIEKQDYGDWKGLVTVLEVEYRRVKIE